MDRSLFIHVVVSSVGISFFDHVTLMNTMYMYVSSHTDMDRRLFIVSPLHNISCTDMSLLITILNVSFKPFHIMSPLDCDSGIDMRLVAC